MPANPFAADIYPDGLSARDAGAVHPLHRGALTELKELVSRAAGRTQEESGTEGGGTVVLLRAPRAGFGKSHLLARLAEEMEDRAFVVGVPFDREREVQWSALLWQVLETFHTRHEGPLTLLDLVLRRTFSLVNQRMIRSGHVPCTNPADALGALEERWAELFDFANPAQPVARWFAEHFERLLPFAGGAAGNMAGLSAGAATHWLRVLCAYGQSRADGDAVRWEGLRWSVMQPDGAAMPHGCLSMVSAGLQGEAGARQRVVEFCRLAAGVRPLVLVFDDLDLFHHETTAVARIAGFITELRRLLSRAVQVLSVNDDLWAQTIQRSIPSAIEDRLTASQVSLGGIGREEAADLIRVRLTQHGCTPLETAQFLQQLNLAAWCAQQEPGRPVSPRTVLRYASTVWESRRRAVQPAEVPMAESLPEIPSVPLMAEDAGLYRADPFLYIPDEPEAAEPAPDPAFQRLRDTLSRMLSPLRGEAAPLISGAVIAAPVEDEFTAAPAEEPVVENTATQLARRFHQLRLHFLNAPWLAIDQERLFHLLKSAGERLAVVSWADHPLPGSPGQSAGAWAGPDSEMIFGSEPYSDRIYWSALIDFARSRTCFGSTSRLIVFSSVKSPVNLSAWMPPDEIIEARTHFLDVHPVDQPTLATLYAADEMMREAGRGSGPACAGSTFAYLIPHIEFLWKQVTRSTVRA